MVRRHCGGSGPRTNNAAYYVCFPRWAADGDGEGGQGRPELSCSFSPEKEEKKKIRFKEEICSRRERGRSPEHPRMIRPFLTGFYRTPQEKGTRQLKIKNENKKTK